VRNSTQLIVTSGLADPILADPIHLRTVVSISPGTSCVIAIERAIQPWAELAVPLLLAQRDHRRHSQPPPAARGAGEGRRVMKHYLDFKYRISARPDGRYLFAVWSAAVNSRRNDPIWHRIVGTEKQAERIVRKWVDDRQPRPRRARPRLQGRR
jgi:hypothetical protein